jgi:hypothetical protein
MKKAATLAAFFCEKFRYGSEPRAVANIEVFLLKMQRLFLNLPLGCGEAKKPSPYYC